VRYHGAQPPKTSPQAPLSTIASDEESGASCGLFIIPQKLDKSVFPYRESFSNRFPSFTMRKIAEKRFRNRDCSSKTQMEAYIEGISFRKIGKTRNIFRQYLSNNDLQPYESNFFIPHKVSLLIY
jgi:hypothetical protein